MANNCKKILMLTAENGALAGGKVGGMGDVLRDLPWALTEFGHQVDVVMPGYQHFSRLRGARKVATVTIEFRGLEEQVEIFRLPSTRKNPGLKTWLIEHPMLAPQGAGKIYCNDTESRPFATDASKFAFFCLAAAQAISEDKFGQPDFIHLHDWHTALLAVLAKYHPNYSMLSNIPLVYSIHNLSLQGVRPFSWDDSALENWYRSMPFDYATIRDPVYDNCFNPMRAAINLCDKIHSVSPTYIKEIQQPSDAEQGFVGGEGLELDLRRAAAENRLVGILNGCEYPEETDNTISKSKAVSVIKMQLNKWKKSAPEQGSHATALSNIAKWQKSKGKSTESSAGMMITSVGRISDQKMGILFTRLTDNRTALEHLLMTLGNEDILVLLGSGDRKSEDYLAELAVRHQNFIFLRGYSDRIAQMLYAVGDLFLMPSSFEPCGISQMLAMRSGQPCLVHNVGGLVDTVQNDVDGFSFSGCSPKEQASNMIRRLQEVATLRTSDKKEWLRIQETAAQARFLWSDVAQQYDDKLYSAT